MIDSKFVGHQFAPYDVEVEAGRLRQFAKAIGETRPEYVDAAAAQAYGWPGLPVPPTLLFGLEMEQPDPWSYLKEIGVDIADVLHGEQEFTYEQQAWAGDVLRFQASIADIAVKREGALELVTKLTEVTKDDGTPVALLRTVIAVVNKKKTSR